MFMESPGNTSALPSSKVSSSDRGVGYICQAMP
jgi:hypothetical protein